MSEEFPESTVYFTYTKTVTGGGICEGDEDSAWPDYEPEYHERTYYSAHLAPTGDFTSGMRFDQVDTDESVKVGDTVYLVDVTYSTGDTFGSQNGYHELVSVHLDKDAADRIMYAILEGTYTSDKGYNSWVGYFEALESVDVRKFEVK